MRGGGAGESGNRNTDDRSREFDGVSNSGGNSAGRSKAE